VVHFHFWKKHSHSSFTFNDVCFQILFDIFILGGRDSHGCAIITIPSHSPELTLNIEELMKTVEYLAGLPRCSIIAIHGCKVQGIDRFKLLFVKV